MKPAILELWEVGLFQAPFLITQPYLFFGFWIAFFLAFGIQWLLLKKCKRRGGQRSFAGFTLAGLVVSEVLCQVITGWDLIACWVLYALFLTFALGIGLASLLHFLCSKKTS